MDKLTAALDALCNYVLVPVAKADGGQIKRSFSSKEQAATAGAVIKKAYPVVMVTIVDTADGTIEVVKA
jgi:PleD family two-component response regulator